MIGWLVGRVGEQGREEKRGEGSASREGDGLLVDLAREVGNSND